MLQVRENFFQLEVKVGKLVTQWNESGRITRLHLQCEYSDILPHSCQGWVSGARQIPQEIIQLQEKLRSYFDEGSPVGEIPWGVLESQHMTAFQKAVYDATAHIPHGETRSYAWVAHRIGKPMACRAVGQALRRNPFPILVPCHRVVTSHGSVGGFMGRSEPTDPTVKSKQRLIDIEYDYRNPLLPFLTG